MKTLIIVDMSDVFRLIGSLNTSGNALCIKENNLIYFIVSRFLQNEEYNIDIHLCVNDTLDYLGLDISECYTEDSFLKIVSKITAIILTTKKIIETAGLYYNKKLVCDYNQKRGNGVAIFQTNRILQNA